MSNLKLIALAKVTEDLEDDEFEVTCVPYEIITDIEGKVNGLSESVSSSATGWEGAATGSATRGVEVKAIWLGEPGNRVTPPNVVLGEDIFLWQYAGDTDTFYWQSRGFNPIRRLEHIVYLFSDTKDEDTESEIYKTAHSLTYSSRDQYIELNTVDANKEKATYNIKLDLKEGIVQLVDNNDNFFKLESVARKATLTTSYFLADVATMRVTGDLIVDKSITGKSTLAISGKSSLNGGMSSSYGSYSGNVDAKNMTATLFTGLFKGKHV